MYAASEDNTALSRCASPPRHASARFSKKVTDIAVISYFDSHFPRGQKAISAINLFLLDIDIIIPTMQLRDDCRWSIQF